MSFVCTDKVTGEPQNMPGLQVSNFGCKNNTPTKNNTVIIIKKIILAINVFKGTK